jgi:hypothetical protein
MRFSLNILDFPSRLSFHHGSVYALQLKPTNYVLLGRSFKILPLAPIPKIFIYGIFNDTSSRSGYIVLDGQMTVNNWKGCQRKMSWPTLSSIPDF